MSVSYEELGQVLMNKSSNAATALTMNMSVKLVGIINLKCIETQQLSEIE